MNINMDKYQSWEWSTCMDIGVAALCNQLHGLEHLLHRNYSYNFQK